MYKIIFLFSVTLVMVSSCQYRSGKRVSGNGTRGSEERNITGFTGAETHGSIDIIASQGSYHVRVETDQNLLQYVETTVENGHLMVRFKRGISLHDFRGAKVYITAPALNVFETHGSGNISSQGKISDKNKIDAVVSGSGDIQLQLDCPDVTTDTHGSGNITLAGESKNLSTRINGSGNVKAEDLKAETVKVSIHGSGDTRIFASESLDVEVSGSGDVHYRGAPRISTSIHGSGSVSKID
ncbi:MAG: head GIN domain-containing protein [Chitinophagaceae bacterium]